MAHPGAGDLMAGGYDPVHIEMDTLNLFTPCQDEPISLLSKALRATAHRSSFMCSLIQNGLSLNLSGIVVKVNNADLF